MQHSPGFVRLVESVRGSIREVTPEEVRARLDAGPPLNLIDVREDHEWQRGRVRGAAHLGKGIIERDIEQTIPDRDAEIVLYCGGGYRSVLAADALQQMGYHRVASMGGGWRRWCELGYPTETG